jgi:hypothetical protein
LKDAISRGSTAAPRDAAIRETAASSAINDGHLGGIAFDFAGIAVI